MVSRHATERVELADERQRDGMVGDVVTADTAAMHCEQMTMKAADNSNEIACILNSIPIGSGLFLDGIGTIGDGGSIGHDLFLGLGCE